MVSEISASLSLRKARFTLPNLQTPGCLVCIKSLAIRCDQSAPYASCHATPTGMTKTRRARAAARPEFAAAAAQARRGFLTNQRAVRQISATEWASAPCFRMDAFWASVNFDAFTSSTLPSQGSYSRKLHLRTIQFTGGRAPSTF